MATTLTKKVTKEKLKELRDKRVDKSTRNAVTRRITDKKDLVYKYPEECDTLDKRKAFRAKTRKKLASLERKHKLYTKNPKKGDAKKIQKDLDALKKSAFSKAE